jgi:hypothetical protein
MYSSYSRTTLVHISSPYIPFTFLLRTSSKNEVLFIIYYTAPCTTINTHLFISNEQVENRGHGKPRIPTTNPKLPARAALSLRHDPCAPPPRSAARTTASRVWGSAQGLSAPEGYPSPSAVGGLDAPGPGRWFAVSERIPRWLGVDAREAAWDVPLGRCCGTASHILVVTRLHRTRVLLCMVPS